MEPLSTKLQYKVPHKPNENVKREFPLEEDLPKGHWTINAKSGFKFLAGPREGVTSYAYMLFFSKIKSTCAKQKLDKSETSAESLLLLHVETIKAF